MSREQDLAAKRSPRRAARRTGPAADPSAPNHGRSPGLLPTPVWNASALRILAAARSLLERSGVARLSMDSVAREAGVDKRLIFYYFKSKAGLLSALIDWIFHDELAALSLFYASLPQNEERVRAVADGHKEMLARAGGLAYQVYLDIAVDLLREPGGRARLAAMLASYRQLNARGLAGDSQVTDDIRALGTMTLALSDGLALQALSEPGAVDTERIWRLWEELTEMVLERSRE